MAASPTPAAVTVAGVLDLFGAVSGASLNGIKEAGGTVNVTATVANAGTLYVGGSSSLGVVTLSGTIAGGTVHDAGSGFNFVGGTLSGVTYQGVLDLSATGANLTVAGRIQRHRRCRHRPRQDHADRAEQHAQRESATRRWPA